MAEAKSVGLNHICGSLWVKFSKISSVLECKQYKTDFLDMDLNPWTSSRCLIVVFRIIYLKFVQLLLYWIENCGVLFRDLIWFLIFYISMHHWMPYFFDMFRSFWFVLFIIKCSSVYSKLLWFEDVFWKFTAWMKLCQIWNPTASQNNLCNWCRQFFLVQTVLQYQ